MGYSAALHGVFRVARLDIALGGNAYVQFESLVLQVRKLTLTVVVTVAGIQGISLAN
jgi:hypothetical protein